MKLIRSIIGGAAFIALAGCNANFADPHNYAGQNCESLRQQYSQSGDQSLRNILTPAPRATNEKSGTIIMPSGTFKDQREKNDSDIRAAYAANGCAGR